MRTQQQQQDRRRRGEGGYKKHHHHSHNHATMGVVDTGMMYCWLLVLLMVGSITTAVHGAVDEREIFIKLYQSTGGVNWNNHTNWATTKPYCTWNGIICGNGGGGGKENDDSDVAGSVTRVLLNQNNLNGEIPTEFWSLPHLQHVQFRGNSITNGNFNGLNAEGSGERKSPVELMVFSENDLTSIDGIGYASSTLKNLNLNKNQLSQTLPDEFFTLTNLETVYMAFNQIQGTIPSLIGKLSKLTELYAFSNQLTGQIPTQIGLLDVCQILGLGNNQFSGTIPTQINQMINMRDLSVHHLVHSGNSDTGLVPENQGISGPLPSFGDMPYLTLLFLDGNSLTGTIPSDFLRHNENTNVPISVGLAGNKLSGGVPKSLERFQSLSIDLVGNEITSIPSELCELGGWMGGLVETYKCDAILCPSGTFSRDGRATSDNNLCKVCNDDEDNPEGDNDDAPTSSTAFLGKRTCTTDPSTLHPWQILAGFYKSMGGELWTISDGWVTFRDYDSGTSPPKTKDEIEKLQIEICSGSFYGIVCENNNIIQLSLPKNELFGTVPDSIFQLSTLQMFDVSGNNVVMQNFHAVAHSLSKSLTTLVLSDIKINSLDGIGNISNLHLLYLDGINIKEPIPSEIFNLINLKILHLQHGSFTGTLPTLVGKLTKLEVYVHAVLLCIYLYLLAYSTLLVLITHCCLLCALIN